METEDNYNQVPDLPCPACIETAAERNEGLVPYYVLLRRYTSAQLIAHLHSDVHTEQEFIEVALRASIHLYNQKSQDGFRERTICPRRMRKGCKSEFFH
jgi:hypothetical protein